MIGVFQNKMNPMRRFSSVILKNHHFFNPAKTTTTHLRRISTTKPATAAKNGDEEWNDAWESAWLPDDLSGKNRAPWETDVNFSSSSSLSQTQNHPSSSTTTAATPVVVLPPDVDAETAAFVEDMTDNWEQRRRGTKTQQQQKGEENGEAGKKEGNSSLYGLENVKRDYRLKKQRVHAGLWVKEIEKQEEAKLGDYSVGGGGDDIERLLDSCSDIFDSTNNDMNESKIPSSSEFKNKPDGWETTAKAQDGSVWEMSQREEDILIQEFERRIAFSKFQIASFIKTHIFSRRRPIDGWKYMIEEIGPNAKRGKGSVPRLPSLSDSSTQPFKEEKIPIASRVTSYKRR